MGSWAKLIPELVVINLERSLHFWCDLVGFSIAYDRPEENFAFLELEGAQIMLEQRDPEVQQWLAGPLDAPLGRGVNFQIKVRALDPILDRLSQAGWNLFMEPQEAWYRNENVEVGQRQFVVMDPDGYLLRLAQDLGERQAVR